MSMTVSTGTCMRLSNSLSQKRTGLAFGALATFNQNIIIMTPLEFKLSQKQYEKQPVIFFFDVDQDRRELEEMSRNEMLEKCICAIPLNEFPDEWNDTDNSVPEFDYVPDVMQTWCAVSMP